MTIRYPPDPRPRLFSCRRLKFSMHLTVGTRVFDLQPGDWILIFENGQIAGWTEAQKQEAIRWAESGGTIPPPRVV